jgi:hypothetical protein
MSKKRKSKSLTTDVANEISTTLFQALASTVNEWVDDVKAGPSSMPLGDLGLMRHMALAKLVVECCSGAAD